MRIYQIALWLLVFNLTLGMLNSFDLFGVTFTITGLGNPDYEALGDSTKKSLALDTSNPINSFISILYYTVFGFPKLLEAISFAVIGLPLVTSVVFGALGASTAGNAIAGVMMVMISLIYIMGMIEFVTGKYIGER